MDVDLAAARLSALGSPTRARLYRLVVRAGGRAAAVRVLERGMNMGDA